MGNNDVYTANINKKLTKMGYRDNPVWSTRKTPITEVLSELSYDKAVEENKMLHLETRDEIKYGILRPVGFKKYTTHTNTTQFDILKSIYGESVSGLYVEYSEHSNFSPMNTYDAQILQKYGCAIIVCNHTSDANNIVAEVLRLTK